MCASGCPRLLCCCADRAAPPCRPALAAGQQRAAPRRARGAQGRGGPAAQARAARCSRWGPPLHCCSVLRWGHCPHAACANLSQCPALYPPTLPCAVPCTVPYCCRNKANLNVRNFNKSEYAQGNWLRCGISSPACCACCGCWPLAPLPPLPMDVAPQCAPAWRLTDAPRLPAASRPAPRSAGKQLQPLHQTALHIAVEAGDAELAETLLKAGADPNATDFDGQAPLAHALEMQAGCQQGRQLAGRHCTGCRRRCGCTASGTTAVCNERGRC